MARNPTTAAKTTVTLLAWAIGLLIFFPILWTVLMSFHSEGDAIKSPWDMLTSVWSFESYAEVQDGQVWLVNANIPEFSHGNRFNHEPKRPRKLLLHEREINKLYGAVARDGMTLVPLSIYFNGRGRAKVELALAKGKKAHDKRETIKERDWKREAGRLLRDRG